jgi:hypothetical protein
MKKLSKDTLLSRRAFLSRTTIKAAAPVVAVYLIRKSTPPLFGQSASGSVRQEPI